MPRRSARPPLAEVQLELMNILWLAGSGTVAEVLDRVRLRREVSRNTVQTMLARLADKGWLEVRDEGGAHVYIPTVPREEAQKQALDRVVETVFDGSTAGVLMALLDNRSLTRDEAARIRRMIRTAEERS